MNTHMQRLLLFSALGMLCTAPALLVLPAVEGRDRNAPCGPAPKIFAHVAVDGALASRTIRTATEARAVLGSRDEAAASAQLARMFKVVNLDWNKQMVLLVSGGVLPTSGYGVQIDKLTVAGNTLTVRWQLNAPGPDDGVLTVLTHPGLLVLCERFEGARTIKAESRMRDNRPFARHFALPIRAMRLT